MSDSNHPNHAPGLWPERPERHGSHEASGGFHLALVTVALLALLGFFGALKMHAESPTQQPTEVNEATTGSEVSDGGGSGKSTVGVRPDSTHKDLAHETIMVTGYSIP